MLRRGVPSEFLTGVQSGMDQSNIGLPLRSVYLPFMQGWRFAMELRPLDLKEWIEIDQDLPEQLRLKQSLLADRSSQVFVSLPESQAAQQEVLSLLLTHLCHYFPQYYQKSPHRISNLITGETWNIADFVANPLNLAEKLVQEDMCLLLPGASGYQLVAAAVCFPSRWELSEKLGQPLVTIHQPVPNYAKKLQRPVDHMFDRLRPEYSAYRFNWSIVDSPDLFLPPSVEHQSSVPEITATNAGNQLWMRVERQTLRRLPTTQAVLFTIRTYVYPLHSLVQDPTIAQRLIDALQQIPESTQQYKKLSSIRSPLLNYLTDKASISA